MHQQNAQNEETLDNISQDDFIHGWLMFNPIGGFLKEGDIPTMF